MTHAETDNSMEIRLPVIPLRDMVIYPNTVVHVDIGRVKSISSIQMALNVDKRLLAVTQRSAAQEEPKIEDLYTVGTIVVIRQIAQLPDGVCRVLIEGESRALVTGVYDVGDRWMADAIPSPDDAPKEISNEIRAYMRLARKLFKRLANTQVESSSELRQAVEGERVPGQLADLIAANILSDIEDRQAVLECRDAFIRLKQVVEYLTGEIDLGQLEKKIVKRVHEQIDKSNRDYFLREQIRAIETELGEKDEDVERYEKLLAESPIAGEARERTEKEIRRLSKMGMSAETPVMQNYIETMLELPWGKLDDETIDVRRARSVLEADHYALEDVKKRILEYLAVRALKKDARGPILCLVGAPGVGKTSITRSVARALGRKFCQVSLGGVHDEAEIRGHRRTYVASMPGRVISAIKLAGSMNPVFLFDEIDKMASDLRGDPASAMLEVLDPEQNFAFRDHYIEAPFDLSKVLFITTANCAENIPAPLFDRMEIIEVPSYTLEDKVQIAKKHLWKKQLAENGLTGQSLRITDNAIHAVIDGYTREAGVRSLERMLGAICRKVAVCKAEKPEEPIKRVTVKPETLINYLGQPKFIRASYQKAPEVGVVNGLAWTNAGGEVMPVEVAVLPGDGKLELTGSLGNVMRESANVAWSYVRSHMDSWGVTEEYRKKHDIHVHVPEGATPKDGPSAGIALACAMMSAVTGLRARQDVCMTGEISLRGKALPIGGVKEKLLAAYRAGMDTVLLPAENAKDLELLPKDVVKELNIKTIADATEAIAVAIPDKKVVSVKAVV